MAKNFIQNSKLRSIGLVGYQLRARFSALGAKGPRVYINSLPKSGTHLLTSELERVSELRNSYVHIKTDKVGSNDENGQYRINREVLDRKVRHVPRGQYFSGHLPFDQEISDILARNEIQCLNLIRDPRDMLVSLAHYVTNLRRHRLHEFMSRHCGDLSEVIQMLLLGPADDQLDAPYFLPYTQVLERFAGWRDDPDTLTLKFEDIVGARGGGDDSLKREALAKILAFVNAEAEARQDAGEQLVTPTLRKGVIGDWRSSFSQETEELCDRHIGHHLTAMGYV